MSYAIHIFMADRFSEKPYRDFVRGVQNLFGKWNVVESTPIYETGLRIHECRIKSEDLPHDEWVSVWVTASRRINDMPMWNFDYEWYLSFETGTGRSPLGLAVQLGALLLATQKFRWILVVDRDTSVKDEPTEFRSRESVAEHIRRVLGEEFAECSANLRRRGIVSEDGYLLLQPEKSVSE